jgi:hypothetical protein
VKHIEGEDVNKIHFEMENAKGLRGDGLVGNVDYFGY